MDKQETLPGFEHVPIFHENEYPKKSDLLLYPFTYRQ